MNSGATAFVYVVLRIFAALASGAMLGWLAGSVWLGISGALGLYLAWNLWQLRALHFWLQHRSVADPPDAMGLWGDVVAQVVRLHRRKRFHKERLTRLFRELRRSTAAMPDGVVMLDPQGEIVWFNRRLNQTISPCGSSITTPSGMAAVERRSSRNSRVSRSLWKRLRRCRRTTCATTSPHRPMASGGSATLRCCSQKSSARSCQRFHAR